MCFRPPAPTNIPPLRFGFNRVGAASVQQPQRDASRGAGDVYRLCQCAHQKLLFITERTPCSFRVISLEIVMDTISTGCHGHLPRPSSGPRSEERRVGKECRSKMKEQTLKNE